MSASPVNRHLDTPPPLHHLRGRGAEQIHLTQPMFTAPKASTTARGYGAKHQAERARRLPHYTPASPCGSCKRPLGNNLKQWHLPHNEQRTGYLPGFWCADCNRKDGAQRGARVVNAKAKAKRKVVATRPSTASRW